MSDQHIKSYLSRGKVYRYFRPPVELAQRFPQAVRLPTNLQAAIRKAEDLIASADTRFHTKLHSVDAYNDRLRDCVKLVFAIARKRAVQKRLPFDIGELAVYDMLRRQRYRCAVTGLQFVMDTPIGRKHKREPFRPSIDRIDSKKGYTLGNCRLVLVAVNYAMGAWGDQVFLKIAQAASAQARKRTRRGRRVSSALDLFPSEPSGDQELSRKNAGAQGRN